MSESERFIDPLNQEWVIHPLVIGQADFGYTAYAYKVGWLIPEPTEQDLSNFKLIEYLHKGNRMTTRSAIGYTAILAVENLKRHIRNEGYERIHNLWGKTYAYTGSYSGFWK